MPIDLLQQQPVDLLEKATTAPAPTPTQPSSLTRMIPKEMQATKLIPELASFSQLPGVQSFARGMAQDISNLGAGTVNLAIKGVNLATGKQIPHVNPLDFEQNVKHPIVAKIGEILDPALWLLPGMEETKLLRFAGKMAPLAEKAITTGTLGALYSAANNGDIGMGAMGGALFGAVGEGIGKAGEKLFANRAFAAGLRTSIKNEINGIINKWKGISSVETSANDIGANLSRYFKEKEGSYDITKENYKYVDPDNSVANIYDRVNVLGDKLGIPINTNKYQKAINKASEDLEKHSGVFADAKVLNVDRDNFNKILFDLKNADLSKFSNADIVKREINNQIYNGDLPGQFNKVLGNIKDALRESVGDTAQESGVHGLQRAWTNADKIYATEIMPFKKNPLNMNTDSPFWKSYTGQRADYAKTIAEHLQPSAKDERYTLTKQIYDLAPDSITKDLLSYEAFKNFEDEPEKFIKHYRKYGESQKHLISGGLKSRLDQLSDLYDAVPGAFKERQPITTRLARLMEGIGAVGLWHYGHPVGAAAILGAPLALEGAGMAAGHIPALRELLFRRLAKESKFPFVQRLMVLPATRHLFAPSGGKK